MITTNFSQIARVKPKHMSNLLRYTLLLLSCCIVVSCFAQQSAIHLAYNGISTIGNKEITYGMSPGVELGYKRLVGERVRAGATARVGFYQSTAESNFNGTLNLYSLAAQAEFLPYVASNTLTPFVGGSLGVGKLILDAPGLEDVGATLAILEGLAGLEYYPGGKLVLRMSAGLNFNAPLSYKSAIKEQRTSMMEVQTNVFKPESYVATVFSFGLVFLL